MNRASRIEEAARAGRDMLRAIAKDHASTSFGDVIAKACHMRADAIDAALAAPDEPDEAAAAALREVAELRARLAQSEANCAALAESNENNNDYAERLTGENAALRARLEDARLCAKFVLNWGVRIPAREAAKRILAHPAPAPATACPECGGTGQRDEGSTGGRITQRQCPACRGGK